MSFRRCDGGALRVRGVVAAAALFVAGLAGGASHATGTLRIEVLSNRADLISGGDALVQVDLPSGVGASDVTMKLGATNVTSQFAVRPNGKYQGLLTGLALGPNTLQALLPDNSGAQITITSHAIGGPVFAGPQVQPWLCNPGAVDLQCNRPPAYNFYYMPVVPVGSKSAPFHPGSAVLYPPSFAPYDFANPPPSALIATTTTDQGVTVPYIVRLETGTIDRSQYQIAVLYEPGKAWEPWAPQPAWNHKLHLNHGGGCSILYNEGATPGVFNPYALARGFAVMSTTFNTGGHNCTVVMAAEALIMAKEHLIEAYGPVRYTFGFGQSGGAIQSTSMANAYPGLYDGIIVLGSFADGWSQLSSTTADCALLLKYWEDPTLWAPGVAWTEPQEAAVAGAATIGHCVSWQLFAANFTTADEGGTVPTADLYDAQANPDGVRSTAWDYAVSVVGRRPAEVWSAPEQTIGHGFANRPIDNVGVQYGLEALKDGLITPPQFVDLNVKAGGRDIDYNWQPQRTQADPAALTAAYRSGNVNQANNLDRIPIIDLRWVPESANAHPHYLSWMTRARLDRANGHHDNHLIWTTPDEFVESGVLDGGRAFDLMDKWLAAVEADTSNRSVEEKVVANKPAEARDRCTAGNGVDIPCLVPPDGSARMGAGGPLADDVAKCQLVPLDRTSYFPGVFSDVEWTQLQATFPTGVCDWSKPGVGQQPTIAWATYENGPGGTPLGSPPQSSAL